MSAHATREELAEIERLEAAVKRDGSGRMTLDLAQLLLEPAHRDDEASFEECYTGRLASEEFLRDMAATIR